jgi:hypothetical protein
MQLLGSLYFGHGKIFLGADGESFNPEGQYQAPQGIPDASGAGDYPRSHAKNLVIQASQIP